jgi:hypothetical protein
MEQALLFATQRCLELAKQIDKMKDLLEEHTGYDMKFVECNNCKNLNILYLPGGTFTDEAWEYCRGHEDFYWCGKCTCGWTKDCCKECATEQERYNRQGGRLLSCVECPTGDDDDDDESV